MKYAVLAALLVAVAACVAAMGARTLPSRAERVRHWTAVAIAGGVLMLLTAIFDNIMIRAGLYQYGTQGTLGVTLGRAPIEDLSYPVACALGVPGLWLLATRRRAGIAVEA